MSLFIVPYSSNLKRKVCLRKQQLFISCDHARVSNRLKIYICCESQEVKLEQDGYDF